jgi:RNA polymerase sigma-70 factor, ECF subfamily
MPESEMTGNLLFFAGRENQVSVSENIRPETRIIELVCAGDRDAFGELYKMYAPMVHGILLARVPRDEVDDIVQEVFISAYNNLHTLRDKNVFGAWLSMITRNRAAEFYRREKPTEELTENIIHKEQPNAEAREILAAIRSLPEAYKETMMLRLVEGMTGQEIAERTGLKPESVRVNLHRGMRMLRKKLGVKE